MRTAQFKEAEEMGISFVKFSNGVVIANTTPHPINIQDVNEELKVVPQCGVLVNARMEERSVDELCVQSVPCADAVGKEAIETIREAFAKSEFRNDKLIIVGSMIAAQAYPGAVVAMTPVPGFERVPPAEKRMRCDKFTTFPAPAIIEKEKHVSFEDRVKQAKAHLNTRPEQHSEVSKVHDDLAL